MASQTHRTYEIRVDEDFNNEVLWRGHRTPTQDQIDTAAEGACGRGWNGVSLELYRDDRWQKYVKPSEGVLS